jgi:hypothetical protein
VQCVLIVAGEFDVVRVECVHMPCMLLVLTEVFAKFLGYVCAGLGARYFCKFRLPLFAACDWSINHLSLSLLYRVRLLRNFGGVREVKV